MASDTVYIAFPSSEILHTTTDGYIRRMRESSARPDPQTLEAIMSRFVPEAIQAFFLTPTDIIGLSPGMRRIVHLTADTISRATDMVVKRTVRKLDLRQHRDAADHMDSMRLMVPDDEGNEVWYIAFPLSDELANRARSCLTQAMEGDTRGALPEFLSYLHDFTDEALHWYFEEPIKLMHFGPIMRKVAEMATETTRKASHSLIRKVFANLEHEQIIESARYMNSLMVSAQS